MALKKISKQGHICFVVFGLVLVICASIGTSSSAWWFVGFQDCGNASDQYFFMVLPDGLCVDTSESTSSDYDTCVKWSDIEDSNIDSDAQDSAASYESANGLVGTALAISLVLAIISFARIFLQDRFEFLRFVQVATAALAAIFFVSATGATGDTYFTDYDNYGAFSDICGTLISAPSGGYVASTIGFILCATAIFCLLFPCCCCIQQETTDTTAINPYGTSSSQNQQPIMAPVYAQAVPMNPQSGAYAKA